jgi:predicted transcriptional regulator
MRVADFTEDDFPHIYEDDSIDQAIRDLVENPLHSLPVFDHDDEMVGELSQTELLLEIIGDDELEGDFDLTSIHHLLSSDADTVSPMVNRHELSVHPDDHILEAIELMYEEDLSTLPVEDKNGFIGIITDINVLEHHDEID